MIKFNIYFQDLKEEVQQELWVLLSKRLIDEEYVQQDKDETEEEFRQRLWEETDHYINTHNLAIEYRL
jgi:hypothetical protein